MKRVYTEEQKARRNRQWRESRLRCGHATLCPACGSEAYCYSYDNDTFYFNNEECGSKH